MGGFPGEFKIRRSEPVFTDHFAKKVSQVLQTVPIDMSVIVLNKPLDERDRSYYTREGNDEILSTFDDPRLESWWKFWGTLQPAEKSSLSGVFHKLRKEAHTILRKKYTEKLTIGDLRQISSKDLLPTTGRGSGVGTTGADFLVAVGLISPSAQAPVK